MGRYPEFCRMSLRPAIGLKFVERLASSLSNTSEHLKKDIILRNKGTVRTNGTQYPIGRYLKDKIKATLGPDSSEWRTKLWEDACQSYFEELQEGVDINAKRKERQRKNAISISKQKQKMKKRRNV